MTKRPKAAEIDGKAADAADHKAATDPAARDKQEKDTATQTALGANHPRAITSMAK